jgi:5,5'-dehydrodivanillate O-demethylase oxygenase subunit
MLTVEENERLTQIGPGTPMGNLLRRYWHPIAVVTDLEHRSTQRVRLFGEDLVIFKDRSGALGLIAEACPHRRASLAYGIPTANGIRCPYHGWEFDAAGRCTEQPNEPAESTLRQAEARLFEDRIATAAYPVREFAGLLFAYMGPLPAPVLTRLDGLVAQPAIRLIGKAVIPCNWLHIMENTADPIHSEWLHGHFLQFLEEQQGKHNAFTGRHKAIAFDEVPYGIIKRRLKEGQLEDCDDWRVGHPLVWPNMLALGVKYPTWATYEFQFRVPADDTHTNHFWFTAFVPPEGADVPPHLLERPVVYDVPLETGELDTAEFQDIMAWRSQGGIMDRTAEHLGSTDRGVILYRRMLAQQLEALERGEPLMLVNHDVTHDDVLDLPSEHGKAHFSEGLATVYERRHWRHSGVKDELLAIFGTPSPAVGNPA